MNLKKDSWGLSYIDYEQYACNLDAWGYDICQSNTKFRGFKTDLLLYRSTEEDKGYISINFRSRKRSIDARLPKQLRVIDVIIKDETDDKLKTMFEEAQLSPHHCKMDFRGDWKFNNRYTNL